MGGGRGVSRGKILKRGRGGLDLGEVEDYKRSKTWGVRGGRWTVRRRRRAI